MNVAEVISRHLLHAQAVGLFSPEALTERRHTLGLFAEVHGAMAVADCRAFHLSDWIESHPGWRSSSTKKGKANQVNACFNWAAKSGRIDKNPFAGVTYPEAEPRPVLADDSLSTIAKLANKAFERALLFLRFTGCRLSDMAGLTWEHLYLERGIAVIDKHKSRKKTGKPKVIVLTTEALELLAELCELAGPNPNGFIFRNNRGTPWNRRTMGQQLRRMKARHGIDVKATIHGLRHCVGTSAVRNGASLKLVSHGLGHASTAITEKFYVQIGMSTADIEAIRAAMQRGMPNAVHP